MTAKQKAFKQFCNWFGAAHFYTNADQESWARFGWRKGYSAGLRAKLSKILAIIDGVEIRAMATDGPVPNTREEMTDAELRRIYELAGGKVKRRGKEP